MQILRKTEEIVYPAAAASAHPPLWRLSETDQLRMPMQRLYFYKQGPASSEALKRSLSKTLALFYPLAGRLVERQRTCGVGEADAKGENENIGGRVDVSCLDQGALFREAWTDTRLDAYSPGFQPHPDFALLYFSDLHHFLLKVQVTYFSCGGICLCVQDHHCLVDGAASAYFTKCWVEIMNGEESPSVCPYINHPPLEVIYRPKDLHNLCIEGYSAYYQPVPSNSTQVELSNKIFHLTPKFIENLKHETSHGGCKYSSFECIAAYMWKNLTLARGIADNEEVCLFFPVNGREKLDPPLPPNYFGNAAFRTHASVKVSDLSKNPLSHIAHLIRKATSKVTNAQIRSMINWSTRQTLPMSRGSFRSPHLLVISHKSFPLCEFDFGWGNPLCTRFPFIPEELVVLIPSSLGKGHIEVLVALNSDHMNNLDSFLSKTILS